MRLLVTGAHGSIGTALLPALHEHDVLATDLNSLDVTRSYQVNATLRGYEPDLVIHLAGVKSAPEGEEHPDIAASVNVIGTLNVVRYAQEYGARVITASTCKACDPETAYGASKLLAERITLQAGFSVARFYNVRESSGNVFETWANLPESEPIPVTECCRYFIPTSEAVRLLLAVMELPSGRYTVDPGEAQSMDSVAARLYPFRRRARIPRRRGDRKLEPLHAKHEELLPLRRGIVQIIGAHDPAWALAAA